MSITGVRRDLPRRPTRHKRGWFNVAPLWALDIAGAEEEDRELDWTWKSGAWRRKSGLWPAW